jgi:hypothetical protein
MIHISFRKAFGVASRLGGGALDQDRYEVAGA